MSGVIKGASLTVLKPIGDLLTRAIVNVEYGRSYLHRSISYTKDLLILLKEGGEQVFL